MAIGTISSGYGNSTMEYVKKTMSTEERYRTLLTEKLSRQDEVIRNGSTEKPVALGSREYTSKEWDALLENFDAVMDDLREQMRIEHKKRYEEQLEKNEDTRKEREDFVEEQLEKKQILSEQVLEEGYLNN